ncbi:MAG: AI-2E family transporter [Candidatus Uhrbacteria bacterium]|nr:AI-2E family transporter [Candidatus Uhrbacteria bacterium]
MSTRSQQLAISRWFFLLVAVLIIYLFWQIVKPFALVLVSAGIIAVVISPIDDRLRKLVKYKNLSAILMVGAVFLIGLIPLFIASVLMIGQATEIIASVGSIEWLNGFDITTFAAFQFFPDIVKQEILAIDLSELGRGAAEWVLLNIGNIFASSARLVFGVFIFFISLYYFLVDRQKLRQEVLDLSPFKDRLDSDIVARIVSTIRNVVFGVLIVAIVQGFFAALGMTIFGVPGALLWGALVVIAAQVPMFGVSLVMVPAIIYLYYTGHSGAAVGLLIWSVVIVGLVDNVLSPLLIQGRTKMHALLILISILGGLKMFGTIGLVIGPTILASIMVVLDLYKAGILEGKQ